MNKPDKLAAHNRKRIKQIIRNRDGWKAEAVRLQGVLNHVEKMVDKMAKNGRVAR